MKSPRAAIRSVASAFGLARAASDAETIKAAIADARTMIAEGERDEAAAVERYRSALLDDDANPEAHLAEQQAAKIRRDRGEARVSELTIRLGAVREADEQARRRQIHDEAYAAIETIRGRFAKEYAFHCGALRGLLAELAAAEMARAYAIKEAPGFGDLPAVEDAVRGAPWTPEDVVATDTIESWVVDGQVTPIPAERVADVRPRMDGGASNKGILSFGADSYSAGQWDVTKRLFRRTRYRERVSYGDAPSLLNSVNLPPLHPLGDAFVTAESLRGIDTALAHLTAERRPDPVIERPIRERLELVPEPPATREEVVPFPKREPEPRRQPSATQIREANTPSRIAAAERQAG